jgi:hypothetical protein
VVIALGDEGRRLVVRRLLLAQHDASPARAAELPVVRRGGTGGQSGQRACVQPGRRPAADFDHPTRGLHGGRRERPRARRNSTRRKGGVIDGVQSHVLSYLGTTWGMGDPPARSSSSSRQLASLSGSGSRRTRVSVGRRGVATAAAGFGAPLVQPAAKRKRVAALDTFTCVPSLPAPSRRPSARAARPPSTGRHPRL